MDGTQFDQLIKRLGTTRVSRLTALRGLVAGAVAGATGMSLTREEAGAKKNNNNNDERRSGSASVRVRIPATCQIKKKEKKKAKKTPAAQSLCLQGSLPTGVSGCATPAPIGLHE